MMIQHDFPAHWPDAFDTLLTLVGSTSDVNLQKSYLKLIVQIMSTLDEELVERTLSKVNLELEKANNVKDGIRAGPINALCALF